MAWAKYSRTGLYKEAIEEYKRVIELDAKHTGAMVQPGRRL